MAVEKIGVTRPLVTKTLRKGAQQKSEIGSKRARSSISETCAIHNPLLRNGLVPGKGTLPGMPLALTYWEVAFCGPADGARTAHPEGKHSSP